MAYPTSVNSQVTDAVTQTNISVVGEAPAMALGMLYQAISSSLGIAAQNAVAAQQQMHEISVATTTACVTAILGNEQKAILS